MVNLLKEEQVQQILCEKALNDFYEYMVGTELVEDPEEDGRLLIYEHDFLGWLLHYDGGVESERDFESRLSNS